jgi:hypothetical protein
VSELGEILAVRKTQHGPFRLHAGIKQRLKEVMEEQANWIGRICVASSE